LRTLARRSSIPVDLDVTTERRLAEPLEAAAYFVASEALAGTLLIVALPPEVEPVGTGIELGAGTSSVEATIYDVANTER
jgi:hypothetical protein